MLFTVYQEQYRAIPGGFKREEPIEWYTAHSIDACKNWILQHTKDYWHYFIKRRWDIDD